MINRLVICTHIEATKKRITKEKIVLLAQDTTDLDYTSQKEKKGVGPAYYDDDLVLRLHPLIAVTPNKICLGVINDYSWHRKELHRKTKTKRELNSKLMHTAIEEKESFRWLEQYRKSCEIAQACPDTQIICVGDRESDIFDIYHDEEQRGTEIKSDWLIRGKTNRAIMNEKGERQPHLLFEEIERTGAVGKLEILLPKRGNQKKRKAVVQVKIKRIKLHPPTGRRGKLRLLPVSATFIKLEEIDPPEDVESVDWLLLSNIHGETFEDAIKFTEWYMCRWQIEIFF